MMRIFLSVLLSTLSSAAAGQQYKTCTISQFKWDDSDKIFVACIEHYNDKGKVISKDYVNSQSVVDAAEDGDDKGTHVFYRYKDTTLMSEQRYRTQEYEDSAITNYHYNEKGQLVLKVIRRHDKFTEMKDGGESIDKWKWLSDSIKYEYNGKGQVVTEKGGERWHKLSYNSLQLVISDTAYSSIEDLAAKNFFAIANTYTADRQLLKRVKTHYIKGKKNFDNTIVYTYVKSKAVKMHSAATSYSKNKGDDARYENMRFDKKFYYDSEGRIKKVETWDPGGFRLQTSLYAYK